MKAVEDALQYIKMYEADVSAKTAKEYLKIFEEQVIRLQSKVWSNNHSAPKTKKYFLKNSTIGNWLVF